MAKIAHPARWVAHGAYAKTGSCAEASAAGMVLLSRLGKDAVR